MDRSTVDPPDALLRNRDSLRHVPEYMPALLLAPKTALAVHKLNHSVISRPAA